MFAELSAIVGTISAINGAINTLKEGKANADDVGRLIGKFGSATGKLDEFERKKKLRRPLTQSEAMDLSIARRNTANTMRQLKDLCLMAGCMDVYNDAERIRKNSELEQRLWLKDVGVKRRKRREKIQGIGLTLFIVASLVFLGWGGYIVYQGWQQANINSRLNDLKENREIMRNIRRCGYTKC
tara:strand:- start:503 stop:1054 length:552 start_codon:yes stop_codon:yes gene_type:complete